jgi:hypothetical protein
MLLALGIAGIALPIACGGDRPAPPKVADAPLRDTQALPTSSVAPDPPSTGSPTPSASVSAKPDAGVAPSSTATGAVKQDECDKVIHTFAELVAKEQGASLMEGFQSNPIYGAMRSLCMMQTTRAQYECAVAAKTTQKWQECMK